MEILCSNFLKERLKRPDLVARLNELHDALGKIDQEERPKGLQSTAAQLISDKLLNNADKEIRLLTACCLVDILRIYAPEAPYSDEEMVAVFEILISQLRGIATINLASSSGRLVFYILHSLATVKSCVVPVILKQNGVPFSDALVHSLFDCLLSSLRAEHSDDGKCLKKYIIFKCVNYYWSLF